MNRQIRLGNSDQMRPSLGEKGASPEIVRRCSILLSLVGVVVHGKS